MFRLTDHAKNEANRVIQRVTCLIALSIAGGVRADVLTVGATRDVTLYSEADDKANGSGDYFFAGRTDGGVLRRGLVRFNVSAIPSGSTINSVTLTLYMSRTRAANQSVRLHRALADWGEGASNAGGEEGSPDSAQLNDATWRYRFYDPNNPGSAPQWAALGGDFVGAASATATVGGNGFYSWSSAGMATDVSGWVNGTVSNYGWILIGNEATNQTAKRFNSRSSSQASRRPALSINFTPPATTGACCFSDGSCQVLSGTDCSAQGGAYQGNGTSCTPNPCPQPTGACCFGDGSCQVLTPSNCTAQGGSYQGNDTTCTPNPCPQLTGACCLPTGYCVTATQADCVTQGGAYQGDGVDCAAVACPILLTPFVDALPRPGVAQPTTGASGGAAHYDIAMTEFNQQLHRDLPPTRVWGYGGSYPGPTIEARRALPVTVTWINDLRDPMGVLRTTHYLPVDTCLHGPDMTGSMPVAVVHLHGGRVAPESDGYPEWTFPPGGQSPLYTYPNDQPASTIWYHDHALGITRLNVYMGLAGFYLVRDDAEDALNLPRGEYEIAMAVQDRSFNPDGTLKYHEMWHEHFFGDFLLVNGKVWPYLNVDQGKYRFRVVNGSTSRVYTLSLSNGATFWQIGTDLGLLPAPVPLTSLTLATGERADLVMDFAGLSAGTEVILQNSAPSPFPGTPGVGVIPNVMKFIVTGQPGHTDPLPASLAAVPPILESEARLSRDFHLRKIFDPVCGHDMWAINDLHWDIITEYPRIGTTEIWNWINRSGIVHPMHMHLVAVQVLDRQDYDVVDGQVVPVGPRVPPSANEAGWKDTVKALPNQITRVIARFDGFTGLYPYHCHIIEHEDHEMMRQFRLFVAGDSDKDGDVDLVDWANFAACFSGPQAVPTPPPPYTSEQCVNDFDVEFDGDVDLEDLAAFQTSFTG